jgi:hypothetical protein
MLALFANGATSKREAREEVFALQVGELRQQIINPRKTR